jgi:hypothetical protein
MTNPYKLSRPALIDLATQMIDDLNSGKTGSLSPEMAERFAADLTVHRDQLALQHQDAVEKKAASRKANARSRALQRQALVRFNEIMRGLSESQREALFAAACEQREV